MLAYSSSATGAAKLEEVSSAYVEVGRFSKASFQWCFKGQNHCKSIAQLLMNQVVEDHQQRALSQESDIKPENNITNTEKEQKITYMIFCFPISFHNRGAKILLVLKTCKDVKNFFLAL